jgi:hypothetical protein
MWEAFVPFLPGSEFFAQLQGKPMNEIAKIEGEVKAELTKFESWIKTLELKFFKGKLHQKVVSPNPGETPDHAWVPIASHDVEAPAAGEPIVEQAQGQTAAANAGAAADLGLQAGARS